MPEKAVIFTHIQKTAGTSVLNELIYPSYRQNEIRRFWGGFGIKKLVLTNTSQYKVFTGHFPYGIHHFIKQDCEYLTFLREPIARAISHYNFIKNNEVKEGNEPNKYQKHHETYSIDKIFDVDPKLNPFKGVLVDNMQTRFLAGYYNYYLSKNSSRMLKAAKKNLKENYKVFGLQERYDESIDLIANAFDWKYINKGVRQKKTMKKDPVDEQTMAIIKENHLLDIELYEYAKELFDLQLK